MYSGKNGAAAVGAPSQLEQPKGKRAFTKDHLTVANGQARLFGGDGDDQTKKTDR